MSGLAEATLPGTRARATGGLDVAVLVELRAALEAGLTPGAALQAAAGESALAPVARTLRVGQPVSEAARGIDTGDPVADLLVRALGVAEVAGAGGVLAVEQAEHAAREEAAVARLLRSRTAQARGTTTVLTLIPLCAWVLLVALDASALAFYTTAPGVATGLPAVALAAAGHRWGRRIVDRAGRAAAEADPLVPPRPTPEPGLVAAVAVPAFAVAAVALGPAAGVVAGAVGATVALRRSPQARTDAPAGGAAEAVELVMVGLLAGLTAEGAVATAGRLAPAAAREPLEAAARRLHGGWTPATAFADGGLSGLGAVLASCARWGAPVRPALRHLADELRADRRAAAEEAAERAQLALVFPTTLLTLPAFVLAVVPPLLWTAFAGAVR